MACFICESIEQNLINVNSEFTRFSKTSFKEIICAFVTKQYEFEIYDEDMICQTCKMLLEHLDKYYSKAREIENIFMAQIYRKYQVESIESHIYNINDKQLRLFNLVPFTKQCVYTCEECGFVTNFEDCIVPHYKFHEENARENDATEDNEDQQLAVCDICLTTAADENSITFHNELFHKSTSNVKLEIGKIEVDENTINYTDTTSELNKTQEYDEQYIDEPRTDFISNDGCGIQSEVQLAEIVHLRCPLCEYCSLQFFGMKNHIAIIHGKLSFKYERKSCLLCDTIFNDLNDIILHAKSHPETTYKCCVCALVGNLKICSNFILITRYFFFVRYIY